MAKATMSLDVQVTQYRLVFFPVATYRRCGDMAILTVLGIPMYKRCGDKRKILWWML